MLPFTPGFVVGSPSPPSPGRFQPAEVKCGIRRREWRGKAEGEGCFGGGGPRCDGEGLLV